MPPPASRRPPEWPCEHGSACSPPIRVSVAPRGRGGSDGAEEGRRSGLGYRTAVGAGRLKAPGAEVGGTGDRLETGDTAQGGNRARPGCAAAQATVIRMAEAPAGRLDVRLGPVELRSAVVYRGIEAGQAGAGGQEDCQQQERRGAAGVRLPSRGGATHVLEYTQTRSTAMARRTGPSAGSRNQKAVPFP
jgi:hypothetical protein